MAIIRNELMTQLLTAEELVRWPLMHGTLACGDELAEIKENGLIAGKETNSYEYDKVLRRHRCIFVAPATFRLQYGFGRGSILIDPSLLREHDLRCSDRDIGEVFEAVKIISENPKGYVGDARDHSFLVDLTAEVKNKCMVVDSEGIALEVFQTEPFKEYVSRNYELTIEGLFDELERRAETMNLEKFFSRTSEWREEILVPERIPPQFLMGHWNGTDWTEWKRPASRDTQVRLDSWLEAAATFRL